MGVTVNHIFTNPVADGTITSIVRPSDWNSAHKITAQLLDRVGVGSDGNTIGNTGLTYGSLYLQGGNNVTLSQITAGGSLATVIFSGANAGGAQTGISSIAASDTTYTSGMIIFSGQNNLTVGSSVNGASQYVRLSVGPYLTTAMASNRGSDFVQATAGFNGTNCSGTIASNSISVSVGAYITTADLSANSSKYFQNWKLTGNTAGTTSSAQGTDLWFEGGNSITVSGNSNTIKLSVGNYLTTAMASNRGTDFVQATAGFNGTNCSGTIASNSFSVSVGAYITTADLSANSSKYVQNWKLTGNTAGTTSSAQGTDLWLSGGNSITVSGNSNSVVFSVGAYITTADLSGNSSKYVQNWKLTGNTAGTTSSAQGTDLWFEGGNSITVSGNSNTVKLSVGAYITTAMASNRASDFVAASAGFNGTNCSGTIASNSFSVSVGAYITTADLSANSSKYVQNWKLTGNTAGTTSSAQGTDLWFSGGNSITVSGSSNTIILSVGNYLTTAMASNRGTDFVQATAVFNGTNASGTIASGAISVSVAAPGAAAENNWVNLLGNNTAGNTTASGSTIGWSGINLTLSGTNNSQVVISAGPYITTGALSGDTSKYMQHWNLTGNTAGTTSSAQGMDLWFSGQNATMSGNSNTVVVSVPPTSSLVGSSGISLSSAGSTITIYQPAASQFDPVRMAPVTNSILGQSTLYFFPFDNGDMLSASRINFFHSIAFTYSGAPQNSTAWLAAGYGLYTRMTGTGTDRISLLTSYSMSYLSGSVSSSTRLSMTNYWQLSNGTTHSTTQYGQNNATAGTYLTSSIGGFRVLAFPVSQLMTPGRYWLGYSVQSASQGASFVLGHSVIQGQFSNQLGYQPFNVVSSASNNSFWDASNGFGSYSAVSAAWPNSIPLTSDSIRAALVNTVPIFNFSGISQSSNIL